MRDAHPDCVLMEDEWAPRGKVSSFKFRFKQQN